MDKKSILRHFRINHPEATPVVQDKKTIHQKRDKFNQHQNSEKTSEVHKEELLDLTKEEIENVFSGSSNPSRG